MLRTTVNRGVSIIEIIVAAFLIGFVILIFFHLMRTSFFAANKGETSAATREAAKTALDRIGLELRQAAAIPGGGAVSVPAVILPGPGGTLINAEASSVGCSYTGCPTGAMNQNPRGPTGFLIFSELKQSQQAGGNIYTISDPNYPLKLTNYVWVMYQVNPPSGTTPAEIVRYTFAVRADGTDIGGQPGGWSRSNRYFVPGNSIEAANNISPVVISAVKNPATDRIWMMVSHAAPSVAIGNTTGMQYDPQLFNLTCIAQEAFQPGAPLDTATLLSQVKIEGAAP